MWSTPKCPNEPASVGVGVHVPVGAVRHTEAGVVVLEELVLLPGEAVGAVLTAGSRPRNPRRRIFST